MEKVDIIILSIVLIISCMVARIILREKYIAWKIKRLETKRLLELFLVSKRKNQFLFPSAAVELKRRKVDIAFTLPCFIEMCLSSDIGLRFLGWASIKKFFLKLPVSIDKKKKHLNPLDIQELREISESSYLRQYCKENPPPSNHF